MTLVLDSASLALVHCLAPVALGSGLNIVIPFYVFIFIFFNNFFFYLSIADLQYYISFKCCGGGFSR